MKLFFFLNWESKFSAQEWGTQQDDLKQTIVFHISDSANLLHKYPGYSRHASSLAQMPPVSERHGARDVIGKRSKIPCVDTTEHSLGLYSLQSTMAYMILFVPFKFVAN